MKKIIPLLIIFLKVGICAYGQTTVAFDKHWFVQNGDTLPYRILLPEQYDPSKTYPMILFFHGRGESGTDNEKQLVLGSKLFLNDSNRKKFPAIVVFPQCAANDYWANVQMIYEGSKSGKRSFFFLEDGEPSKHMALTMSLLNNILLRYPIKKEQVYVMGLSMGGMATFEIVRRMPNLFAAAIPICGAANPAIAKKLKHTNWWIFHGAKDDVVLPDFSIQMNSALQKQRASVRFTLFPNANHNSWDPTFAQPGLLDWLFAQRKN